MDYPCEQVVPIDEEPRHHLVIANEYVRAFVVEIAPHDRTLCHHHEHDYLLYVAGSAEVVSAAQGEEPKRLSYSDGECELSCAGLTHVVENLRDTPFTNVVVELLPDARLLRRGAAPGMASLQTDGTLLFEETSVMELLRKDMAAIFSVQIEPGAEIVIPGPAVIASPYGYRLGPDAIGEVETKQQSHCALAWIGMGREAALYGCWEDAATVVAFQVGGIDQQSSVAARLREPLRSLRAYADEPK